VNETPYRFRLYKDDTASAVVRAIVVVANFEILRALNEGFAIEPPVMDEAFASNPHAARDTIMRAVRARFGDDADLAVSEMSEHGHGTARSLRLLVETGPSEKRTAVWSHDIIVDISPTRAPSL